MRSFERGVVICGKLRPSRKVKLNHQITKIEHLKHSAPLKPIKPKNDLNSKDGSQEEEESKERPGSCHLSGGETEAD